MIARAALALLLCWPALVRAQAQRGDVIFTGGALRSDVFEILRAAFARDGMAFQQAAAAPACAGSLAQPSLRARVWISWAPVAGELTLCFQDQCRSATRTLGPFATLDARAREELITVVESGLSAMPERCSEEALPADGAPAHIAPARETTSAAAISSSPAPAGRQARPASEQPAQVASLDTVPALPPSAATSPRDTEPPPTASGGERAPQPQRLIVGASYGLARWGDGVLAQQLAALLAFPVQAQRVFLGLELGVVPGFRAQREALTVDASCVRIALLFWARWPLSQRVAVDAQLGPAIEWLSVEPAATTVVRDTRATSHADPLLSLKVGPSLLVLPRLRLGLDVQLDGAVVRRSFGFMQNDAEISVFSPDRFRLSLAMNVKAEL